jgi:hypothetical protein
MIHMIPHIIKNTTLLILDSLSESIESYVHHKIKSCHLEYKCQQDKII